jgi:hypothetical protein
LSTRTIVLETLHKCRFVDCLPISFYAKTLLRHSEPEVADARAISCRNVRRPSDRSSRTPPDQEIFLAL